MEGRPLLQNAGGDSSSAQPFEAKNDTFGLNAEVCTQHAPLSVIVLCCVVCSSLLTVLFVCRFSTALPSHTSRFSLKVKILFLLLSSQPDMCLSDRDHKLLAQAGSLKWMDGIHTLTHAATLALTLYTDSTGGMAISTNCYGGCLAGCFRSCARVRIHLAWLVCLFNSQCRIIVV